MKTIYKYPLEITDLQEVEIPEGAQILCVKLQKGTLCLWAVVDPAEKLTARRIQILGTGHPIHEPNIEYIGTFLMNNDSLVFHVFEVLR